MGYTQQLLFASTAYVRISEIQFCPTEVVVQNKGVFTTYFVILRSEQIPFLMLCASLVCTIRTVRISLHDSILFIFTSTTEAWPM